MGRKRAVVPKAREFKGSLTCWANGKRHYFGRAGTKEADEAYRTFAAQYLVSPTTTAKDATGFLAHLIRDFLASPDAPRSAAKKREIGRLVKHLGPLAQKRAASVSAQELKAWIKGKADEADDDGEPKYSQTTMRLWFAKIKQVYAWGIESHKITGDAAAPILAIRKLPIESARPEEDIEPVPRNVVEATLPFLTPTVRAMVELQLLTAMRPSDLFNMTAAEVLRGGVVKLNGAYRDLDAEQVWVYVRKKHKTARFGKSRVIPLGDEAKAIIEPRMGKGADAPLFEPVESVAESYNRTHLDMKRAKPGARKYNARYTHYAYAQAIERAAVKAGVMHWTPYQIRHLRSGEVQAEHDIDTARAVLGQKSVNVAAKYADHDFGKAAKVARNAGKPKEQKQPDGEGK